MNATLEISRVETQKAASIEIKGITFQGGDPCRPRYEGFYKKPHSPIVQLEPAFQVGDGINELSVTLGLASPDVVFVEESSSAPLCRVLNHPADKPLIEFVGADHTTCRLTWKRAGGPKTRVYRIYCRRKNGKFTDEHKVHGGLFLAFTTENGGNMGKPIPPQDPGNTDRQKVYLIGADQKHRPVYDLHHETKLPDRVESEPAFRVREGKVLEFEMNMYIKGAEWKKGLKFLQPPSNPEWLSSDWSSKIYTFRWQSADRQCKVPPTPECKQGEIVSFHLYPTLPARTGELDTMLEEMGWIWEDYKEAVEAIGIDPTIIQPPSCDPVYNVCSG